MAKEKTEPKDGKEGGAKKRLHLHQIRTVEAEDGTHVHHHTYKTKRGDHYTMPERENVATSMNEKEAGQHVAEQFGINQQPGAEEPEGGEEAQAGGGAMGGGAPGPMAG